MTHVLKIGEEVLVSFDRGGFRKGKITSRTFEEFPRYGVEFTNGEVMQEIPASQIITREAKNV